ncbi:MAG: septum formation initiator family protein [Bacteroides sp.]|nr:septum formation initiator family protein [Bacteroides sp.]MDD2645840.1 septum formation initiator family protein [Bacteroides sp.]MDD4055458.1 septum formation initiator family protein [Bacteroides sp.]MDD4720927.1 septum formation initiator family protein [Bacteroides sp.]NLI64451.1 septum formation initiator family protein [Bacteroidales bacterium]
MKQQIISFAKKLRNHKQLKYIVTIAIFLLIIGIIDQNSLIKRAKYNREIRLLQNEIKRYQQEYDNSTKKLNELLENPENLERIARENYLMKKPDEDIFVFE